MFARLTIWHRVGHISFGSFAIATEICYCYIIHCVVYKCLILNFWNTTEGPIHEHQTSALSDKRPMRSVHELPMHCKCLINRVCLRQLAIKPYICFLTYQPSYQLQTANANLSSSLTPRRRDHLLNMFFPSAHPLPIPPSTPTWCKHVLCDYITSPIVSPTASWIGKNTMRLNEGAYRKL